MLDRQDVTAARPSSIREIAFQKHNPCRRGTQQRFIVDVIMVSRWPVYFPRLSVSNACFAIASVSLALRTKH